MTRRFPNGRIPVPQDRAELRDLCIDAVAELDVRDICYLVYHFEADKALIADVAGQVDRSVPEILEALQYSAKGRKRAVRSAWVNAVVCTLTQETLF